MLTRTDRRRFPVLLAVIAVLALAMAMLFSPVQAQAAEPPDQPAGLEATATHDSVTLTWDDPGDDSITGYVVLRRVRVKDTGGDFSVLVANTNTAALSYTDDTVAASTTYTYRIKAINEHGVSERSRWFHIDTPAAPEAAEGDEQDGEDDGGAPGGPGRRANVSEGGTDCPGDNTTTCEVDVGGSVTGNIGTGTDADRFKVVLEADTRYQIDLEGADTGRGTLPDPRMALFDGSATLVGSVRNDEGVGKNARGIYTPTAGATYYVHVQNPNRSDTGTYRLSVIVLGANGNSEADTDFPATTATTGRVDVGASATGNLRNNSDVDWFRVDLEADKQYQFDQEGAPTGRGTLTDPRLALFSGSGISIALNDDISATNLNSRIFYTATETGAHYLRATRSFGNIGTYTLSVHDITPPPSTDATLSALSVTGGGSELITDFASGTLDYSASVANSVDEVTFALTTNHAGATVEYLDAEVVTLTDADDMEDGFQIALAVGSNYIILLMTAEDGISQTFYAVDVTRAAACTLNEGDLWCGVVDVEAITNSGGTTVGHGFSGTTGDIDGNPDDKEFTVPSTSNSYTITSLLVGAGRLVISLDDTLSEAAADNDRATLELGIDGVSDPFPLSNTFQSGTGYRWNETGLDWSMRSTVTVRLREEDRPTLSVADATGAEGDDKVVFTVTLSKPRSGESRATWTASIESGDTAVAADLGTTKTGTVAIAAGATTATFEVPVVDDATDEEDETFTVTLSSPYPSADVKLATDATAKGTILDDDATVTLPTLSVADAEGDEDDGVEFTATLTTAVSAKVTATWTASIESGDTASAADLAATKTGEVEFDADATEAKFTVPLTDDTTDEPDQTFTVTLSGVSTNAQLAADPTAEGTIDDDDDPPTLSVGDLRHDEGDLVASVTVSLSEVSEKDVGLRLRALDRAGDTASDADWNSTGQGVQTIHAGTMSASRGAVLVLNDTLDEDDETLTVEAYSLENAQGSSSDREATITIVDDDPTPTVTVADAAATEGDKVEFVVTLSAVSGRDVEVGYATSVATGQTATSDTDFTAASGTLTILASDSTATGTVEVQTTDDDASESAETFTLTLSATKNVALGTPSTATGTINDDATDDCPADTTTTCEVDVGGSATGNIENEDDEDWFKVVLEANKTYQIDMKGEYGGGGTLEDPLLDDIRDSSGTGISDTGNDDVDADNDNYDSRTTFTPTTAGAYYLVATTADDSGTYTLSVREIQCTLNDGDIWCGKVTVAEVKSGEDLLAHGFADTTSPATLDAGSLAGNPDDRMFSVGDNEYTVQAVNVGTGSDRDGKLGFWITDVDWLDDHDEGILVLTIDGVATPRAFDGNQGLLGGLYSWDTDLDWSSTPEVTVRLQTPDDFSAGTTTTGEVDVGGSVTGNIETVADYGDWFKVELEADTRYQIDLEGADTGRGTLVDPAIELLANSIGNTVPNTGGSDSGVGKNDRTIYTPSTSDAYYVVVQPSDTGLGTYTLSVIVLGANGVSEADTDFPTTTATTGRVDVGASATGNISTSGDNDLFRVELEAGKEYQFDLEGAATTRGTLSDPYLGLYDGSRSLITSNDDIDSNTNPNSQIVYTATATGAHYLAASGRGGSMGTYTFSVRDVTPVSDNTSPSFSSSATISVAENDTSVGLVRATDSDADDSVTGYAITGGADMALFEIGATSGELTFKSAPNFEDPQDSGTDNVHEVTVQATSGTDTRVMTATQTITVTVTNVDEGQSGTVTIDDTAPMVGDELTASTANAADPDGLPDPFAPTWKWYRTPDGGSETEISGAAATYTVVAADLGATLTAKASWTDNGMFANTLSSAPTSAVAAASALPTLSISDAQATEGALFVFILSLSVPASEDVPVTCTASFGSGDTAVAEDLTFTSANASIRSGQAASSCSFRSVQDTTDEEDETFTVTLSTTSSNAQLATDPTAKGTINDDDDPPTLSVADVSGTEGTALTFTVTLSDESGKTVTVDYATSVEIGDTATSGTDFTAKTSTTLTFEPGDPGDTTKTFTVQTTDDTDIEEDETFTVTLSNPSDATISDATAKGTIENDDEAALDVLVSNYPDGSGSDFSLNFVQSGNSQRHYIAQTFTAGAGFTLTAVDIPFRRVPDNSRVTVSLHALNGSKPGPYLAELDLSGALAVGDNTFAAPAGTALAAGSYFVRVRWHSGDTNNLKMTDGPDEETSAESGWSIEDRSQYSASGSSWSNWNQQFAMRVRGTIDGVPRVATGGVRIESDPDAHDSYGVGEEIEVAVGFTDDVTVDTTSGTPRVELTVGSNTRYADYSASDSSADELAFLYEVTVDDHDQDGVSIDADALELNGGAIHKDGDTSTNAVLGHAALDADSDHRVNRDPFIVSDGVSVISDPQAAADTYGLGEVIEIEVEFSAAVDATTGTDFVLSVSGPKRAPLLRGSGTKKLVFGYTVVASDDDDSGIWIGDQDRTLVGNRQGDPQDGEITSAVTDRAADLDHDSPGVLSGHKVDGSRTTGNTAPSFSSSAAISVAENQTTVVTVVATDSDTDDDVTGYAITGGADQAFFSIGATSGALTFDAAPNYEDAKDQGSNNTYVVEVTATSGAGTRVMTATQTITVTVTDVNTEAPGKPGAPTVSSASATSLSVNWSAPTNAGPAITDYDVQYRAGNSGGWSDGGHVGTATTATLTGLSEDTSYQVQVRATNDEGTGAWSDAVDNCSADTDTTCEVDVGGSATGYIAGNREHDWFKVVLEADKRYQFDVEGADTNRGNLVDPYLWGGYDSTGSSISDLRSNDGGVGKNGRDTYTPTAAGTYYIAVADATFDARGTYTVSVIVLGADGASEADTDCPATTATTCRVEVGASATGNIGTDTDDDWFRVDLEAGKTYQFDMEGMDTGRGTQPDPYVVLVNPSGTIELGDDNDGGVDKNARLIYTADATGTHYVAASPANDNQGTYTLSVRDVTPPPDDCTDNTATTCEVDVGGSVTGNISDINDKDWFKVELEAGTRYQFDLEGDDTTRGNLGDPYLQFASSIGNVLGGTQNRDSGVGDNARVIWTPANSANELVYLIVEGAANTTGTYTLSVIVLGANGASEADTDFPNTTATTGRVEVGASATGRCHPAGDFDRFRVDLEAGKTYQFDLEGAPTGRGTLEDPFLRLLDGTGNEQLALDDDDGTDVNSKIVYTATATGAHYLEARSVIPGGGTYTLSVRDITPVSDNAAPTFSSDATISVAENETAVVTVAATDSDADDSVTGYAITGGADMALFEIGATSGELTFKSAPNFEDAQDQGTNNTYVVDVTATSGAGTRVMTATQTITVTVTDVDTEAPGKPAAPMVSAAAAATSLSVNWSAPANAGPAITDYDVQYREGNSGDWTDEGYNDTETTATLRGLSENTSYQVQVRATNDEGTGAWSDAGSGTTDPASDDCLQDTTTTCKVDVGGSATGNLESGRDRDWFKVDLVGDTRYQIDVEGDDTDRGTLVDPHLGSIHNEDGTQRGSTGDRDAGVGSNSREIFTPTDDGTYYVAVAADILDDLRGPGNYTLSVIVLGANGNSEADTDFPATTATTGRVEVGASVTGNVATNFDGDRFRVDLEADKTYQFDLEGAPTGRGTLADPFLSVTDESNYLDDDDNSGTGLNSRITFTTTAAGGGTYYLTASDPDGSNTGTYTLSVRDVTPPEDLPADTTTTGTVEVGGAAIRGDILAPKFVQGDGPNEVDGWDFDTDWFEVELEADKTYRIDMWGHTTANGLTLRLPQINAIYDADGDYLVNTWSSDESDSHYLFRVTFHVHDDGAHYIAASGESFESGTYKLWVKDITEDDHGDHGDEGDEGDEGDGTNGGRGLKNLRAVEEKGGVRLTWQSPDGAAVTGYRIERRRADGQGSGPQRSHGQPGDHHTLVEDTGNTETSYVDESAEQGVEYEYQVSAHNESGPGEESDWVRAGPEEEPVLGDALPGAPRNLTATPGNREVTLSWDPPDDNGNPPATRYRIEWRVDGKDYDRWSQWGTSRSTTYTTNDQANLANGVKYFFRVKAENDDGNSYGPYGPASEEVSSTPTSGSAVDLDTPVLSDTEILHHGMVQLDWQDIEDAGWYVVQYYHLEDEEWLDLPAEGVDIAFHGSSAVVSNLHGLSWLRVGAASCAGASEWSQIEQLFGTNASDWEGVPVPEVEEGDEIEPCPVVLGTPVLSDTETCITAWCSWTGRT